MIYIKKLFIIMTIIISINVFNGCSKSIDEIKTDVENKENQSDSSVETNENVQSSNIYQAEEFDIKLSNGNELVYEGSDIFKYALNSEKEEIKCERHFPIYKFDTLDELEKFKNKFNYMHSMNYNHEEVPAFNDVTKKYEEIFFEENTLLLVYVEAISGSLRYWVNSVYCDNESLCIYIEQSNNPEWCTDDMAGWFITVAVADSLVEKCIVFDAIFVEK